MLDLIRNNFVKGSQIPHRFGYKNWEMAATDSARNFLRSKRGKTLSKIKQLP
jgi:hypothetical protein